jgi:hypothetical protein
MKLQIGDLVYDYNSLGMIAGTQKVVGGNEIQYQIQWLDMENSVTYNSSVHVDIWRDIYLDMRMSEE